MAAVDLAKPPRRHAAFRHWAALVMVGLLWGATGPFAKLSISTGHHPVGVAFWTTAVAALALTVWVVATRRRLPTTLGALGFYGLCGFLGTALPHSLSYSAYAHLPIGIVQMVVATVPMATLVFAWSLRLEKPDLSRTAGVALGALAVAALVLPDSSLPAPGQAFWVGVMVIVAISYAGENIALAALQPKSLDALSTLCGLSWAALALLAPSLFIEAWRVSPSTFLDPGVAEGAMLVMALLHLGAYGGFIWLVGAAGPVFAAQVGYVVTGAGVAFGVIFFNESHAGWVWAALVLMAIGLALVTPRERDARAA